MAAFRETWHFIALALRWLAFVPLFVLGLALALHAWVSLWLLRTLAIAPMLELGPTNDASELLGAVSSFAVDGQCPRCGWRLHMHLHRLLTGHVPPSTIQVLHEGPLGTTVLIDGWLAVRAIAAVEHVKQIGGDPCVVAATLFAAMGDLAPKDLEQRFGGSN